MQSTLLIRKFDQMVRWNYGWSIEALRYLEIRQFESQRKWKIGALAACSYLLRWTWNSSTISHVNDSRWGWFYWQSIAEKLIWEDVWWTSSPWNWWSDFESKWTYSSLPWYQVRLLSNWTYGSVPCWLDNEYLSGL